jgi:hypothetical protein
MANWWNTGLKGRQAELNSLIPYEREGRRYVTANKVPHFVKVMLIYEVEIHW